MLLIILASLILGAQGQEFPEEEMVGSGLGRLLLAKAKIRTATNLALLRARAHLPPHIPHYYPLLLAPTPEDFMSLPPENPNNLPNPDNMLHSENTLHPNNMPPPEFLKSLPPEFLNSPPPELLMSSPQENLMTPPEDHFMVHEAIPPSNQRAASPHFPLKFTKVKTIEFGPHHGHFFHKTQTNWGPSSSSHFQASSVHNAGHISNFDHHQHEDFTHNPHGDFSHNQQKDFLHNQQKDSLHNQQKDFLHHQQKDFLHNQHKDFLHDQQKDFFHNQHKDFPHNQHNEDFGIHQQQTAQNFPKGPLNPHHQIPGNPIPQLFENNPQETKSLVTINKQNNIFSLPTSPNIQIAQANGHGSLVNQGQNSEFFRQHQELNPQEPPLEVGHQVFRSLEGSTPREITPNVITPQEMTPRVMTPQMIIPQEITPQELLGAVIMTPESPVLRGVNPQELQDHGFIFAHDLFFDNNQDPEKDEFITDPRFISRVPRMKREIKKKREMKEKSGIRERRETKDKREIQDPIYNTLQSIMEEDSKILSTTGKNHVTKKRYRSCGTTRRFRRHVPLMRLITDPNVKLDVPKTMQNIGTVTKRTFEDKRAPMYHMRNMLGSAKNVVLSALKIPPQDLFIPSQYRIVDTTRKTSPLVDNLIEDDVVQSQLPFLEKAKMRFKLKRRKPDAFKRLDSLKKFWGGDDSSNGDPGKNDLKDLVGNSSGKSKYLNSEDDSGNSRNYSDNSKDYSNNKDKIEEPEIAPRRTSDSASRTSEAASRRRTPEVDDPYNFLGTFQKVGTVLRESIKSGQETLQHMGDVAHSARKAFATSRFSAPRILLPYARTTAMVSRSNFGDDDDEDVDKVMLITPKVLDVKKEQLLGSPMESKPEFVSIGEVMDALGMSHPEKNKFDLTKIVIHKPKPQEVPNMMSRSNFDEDVGSSFKKPEKKFFVVSDTLSPQDDLEGDSLYTLDEVKELIGGKNLKDFVRKMKKNLKRRKEELQRELEVRKAKMEVTTLKPSSSSSSSSSKYDSGTSTSKSLDSNTPSTESDHMMDFDPVKLKSPFREEISRESFFNEQVGKFLTDLFQNNSQTTRNASVGGMEKRNQLEENKLQDRDPISKMVPRSADDDSQAIIEENIKIIFGTPGSSGNSRNSGIPGNLGSPGNPESSGSPPGSSQTSGSPGARDEETVGDGLALAPGLLKPFMGLPSKQELENYFESYDDDFKQIEKEEEQRIRNEERTRIEEMKRIEEIKENEGMKQNEDVEENGERMRSEKKKNDERQEEILAAFNPETLAKKMDPSESHAKAIVDDHEKFYTLLDDIIVGKSFDDVVGEKAKFSMKVPKKLLEPYMGKVDKKFLGFDDDYKTYGFYEQNAYDDGYGEPFNDGYDFGLENNWRHGNTYAGHFQNYFLN